MPLHRLPPRTGPRQAFRATLAVALAASIGAQAREARALPFRTPPIASPILAEAARHLGQGNFTRRPGAWCAWFASAVLEATGHKRLPNGLALSALNAGPPAPQPAPGDLVVMRGHVTFLVRFDGRGAFIGLGGNQGHRVRYSRFLLRSVIAFVRPT